MQQYFHEQGKNSDLTVFLMGWGMDERLILPLCKGQNVLCLYDYQDLDFHFDFTPYKNCKLIAYSAGVFMAKVLKDKLPDFSQSVAVNGVQDLFSLTKGMDIKSMAAFGSITLDNYIDFRRNFLVDSDAELAKFNANAPLRTIESSNAELKKLVQFSIRYKFKKQFDFDKIFISENDKTIPTSNQKKAWAGKDFTLIKGNHFPFYNFETLNGLFTYQKTVDAAKLLPAKQLAEKVKE